MRRRRSWRPGVGERLKFRSLRGGEGVRERGRECEHSLVDSLRTASDSAVSRAARNSIVTAGVAAAAADTVVIVGALATIIASTLKANCSKGKSDTSRICWISAGSRLRKRERSTSGEKIVRCGWGGTESAEGFP